VPGEVEAGTQENRAELHNIRPEKSDRQGKERQRTDHDQRIRGVGTTIEMAKRKWESSKRAER
jgi:hypothetical protein